MCYTDVVKYDDTETRQCYNTICKRYGSKQHYISLK